MAAVQDIVTTSTVRQQNPYGCADRPTSAVFARKGRTAASGLGRIAVGQRSIAGGTRRGNARLANTYMQCVLVGDKEWISL